MKRIYLILTFLLSLCLAHSQEAYPQYALGVRGGTTWSMMLFNPSISQPSMPMTYHAGAQFRMVSEKYVGLKLELNYAQKGFKDTYGHRRLDYVELPFMTHITFGQRLFRFFIDLGPEIAYLIRDNSIAADVQQHALPVKNRFDYGIVGGLGFEFNTRTGIYTIDARYHFGLNNVMGNSASEYFKSSTNQNITLSIAYLFPFQ